VDLDVYTYVFTGIDYSYTGLNGALSRADMQNSTSQPLEGNIDMQYLISTGYPVNVHTYNVAGRGYLVPDLDFPSPDKNSNEPYLDWLNYMLSQNDEDLPHTVSVSYSEAEQTVPQSYRQKVCEMLGQLGARGVSLIFATGDNGPGGSCQTNDGRNVTRFQPNFPATCPYVTSVGSTSGINPERASGFSSGGFSDTWQRPSYQDKAVTSYLDTLGDQWRGLYNDQGRGIPDVSAQGHLLHVINRGADKLPSGTSLSAPVFAGIIALINAQRLKAGKKTLGFLNPWIYSSAYEALNDVIDGISIGCSATSKISGLSSPFVPGAGWNATQGWDAVTGYGTPDYDKLLSLAMDLA
jgi:tripeptidyl-peptidase-1